MPVVTINSCTEDAVLDAILACGGSVSYETDNSEALATRLGFERNQANLVFGHLHRLSRAKKVRRTHKVAEPQRLHDREPAPAIVKVVTFTVVSSTCASRQPLSRDKSPYFVR